MYDESYIEQRQKLVKNLIKKGIKDSRVLYCIGELPREFFIEKSLVNIAYDDHALPIEAGQTISQPYTIAYMMSELDIQENDKVLEIGTGSGYQACLLKMMQTDVFTIERIEELYELSKERFEHFNMDINILNGDGTLGWSENAPFDKIIVAAAAPDIPGALLEQLAIGGKLVIPVGTKDYQTMTVVVREKKGKYTTQRKDTFKFVPLIGEDGW